MFDTKQGLFLQNKTKEVKNINTISTQSQQHKQ